MKIAELSRRARLFLLGTIGTALLIAACAPGLGALQERVTAVEGKAAAVEGKTAAVEAKAGRVVFPSGERTFYLTGAEIKGSTSTTSLAAPTADPTKLSDGYRYKVPGVADKADATKWEVSSYVWLPGALTAYEGDKVSLVTFIINGDKHTFWVEGPDGKEVVREIVMNRGREYKVSFTVSQPGVYLIHCNEHDPTMTSLLLVLPRG